MAPAASMGLASAAQAQATKEVPTTRTLNPRLLVRLAHRPLWLVGIVATLGGLGLQVVALGYGPLILVQPLLVTALPFASVFAAAMTHRRVDRVTVLGCLVCVAGLSSFLLLARPSDDGSDGMVEADRVLPLALALAVLMLLGLAVSSAVRGSVRVLGLALATGVMYGVTAGLIKIVAGQLRLGLTEPFTHWALYTVCVIGPIGFLLSQNTFQQGLAISPALALRLADACRNITYIKVETLPVTSKVQAMSSAARDRLTIFGGAGGSYFIEEMRRGADGTMPFCSQPEDFVAVWDAFQKGDEQAARERFDATIMAVNRLGNQGGDIFYAIHKQLLVRRGIIRTAFVRSPTTAIDPITQREIDELLAAIVPAPVAFGA